MHVIIRQCGEMGERFGGPGYGGLEQVGISGFSCRAHTASSSQFEKEALDPGCVVIASVR